MLDTDIVERVTASEYHERTKHFPEELRNSDFGLDFSNEPTPYKTYRDPRVELASRVRPPQIPALAAIDAGNPASERARDPDLDAVVERSTHPVACQRAFLR